MNNTLQSMRNLRLTGMADRYEAIFSLPPHQRPQKEVLIAQLLEAEDLYRTHRRSTLAIKNARFRYQSSIQELNFSSSRNLDKDAIIALSDCSFIERGENILITGSTGCGKSFLASALGHQACLLGKKVAYFSLPKLLSKIKTDKIDGAFRKEIERIESKQLLILDDFLLGIERNEKERLLNYIINGNTKTTVIISNDPLVMKLCNKVIILKEGEINATGKFEDIKNNQLFKRVMYR